MTSSQVTHQFTITPQLRALRWRLLASSLGVIGVTLTGFGLVVYQVVAQGLDRKSDRQLTTLADAAAHSLPQVAANPSLAIERTPRRLDNDGDLDIPWQDLQQDQQSVEWFNAQGQLLARAGHYFTAAPLSLESGETFPVSAESVETEDGKEEDIHTLTIPVYAGDTADDDNLQGYVRVTESNKVIEEELERLRSGLLWGSLLALIWSGVGGWWLTRQSLQPIDRSIRQLKQFTADASHELRNPLTAIKASVEVMQSHRDRFQAADLAKLGAIASATNQMSQLVDDLLWLARSDRTTMPSSPSLSIPIADLLEEVVDQYLSQAEQKQIDLKLDLKITELEDVSVWGEPFQLKRLLGNLLTNAIHYTPPGGSVTLSATVPDDVVQICVADTGIGIAAEHLPFVFDRFWRADQARARREGGSGLGLAIAQAIAHQHHGQITVRSELGQGSCFQVELPIA
ncbi:MAG TPA: HAMP domain-containing sensor histidine kinase [Chroococcidiopsis sp.]